MMRSTDHRLLVFDSSRSPPALLVSGEWTLANYAELGRLVGRFLEHQPGPGGKPSRPDIDLTGLAALDTAGASRLLELLGLELAENIAATESAMPAERRALLKTVAAAQRHSGTPDAAPIRRPATDFLASLGFYVADFTKQMLLLLGFVGLTLEALVRGLFQPSRWRITSTVAQIQAIALNAVPIVALLTFMVGAVVAFLGASALADFGATIYTVDLVALAFLREFAVLLTAILVAGRTASAFTAQLGSMKANEEIDAIRTIGLSPIDLLVSPRIWALLVSLPILTFVGMIAGILGGAVVCAFALDISPTMFLTIFKRDVELTHFLLGMGKAPIFAYVIAVIGCLEGFKVAGSAQSVGEHTTSAVVQSIFAVILLDALAALFFMEMGW